MIILKVKKMEKIAYTLVLLLLSDLVVSARITRNGSHFKVDWSKVRIFGAMPQLYKFNEMPSKRITLSADSGKIVGGEVAPVGEYPYHVGIVANFGGWCGGVLISDRFVMTAAHCTYECSYVFAYLGAHNIRDDNDLQDDYQIFIKNIIHHPEWDWETYQNDISLLTIPEPIQFTDRIQPIALPSRSDDKMDLEFQQVIATGWGFLNGNNTDITPLLRNVKLRVYPEPVCNHFYTRILKETNFCTDSGLGKGVCTRDDGGPLTYIREDGTRFVAGIVSFVGFLGCHAGWPTMHTRVSKYLDWIGAMTGIPIKD